MSDNQSPVVSSAAFCVAPNGQKETVAQGECGNLPGCLGLRCQQKNMDEPPKVRHGERTLAQARSQLKAEVALTRRLRLMRSAEELLDLDAEHRAHHIATCRHGYDPACMRLAELLDEQKYDFWHFAATARVENDRSRIAKQRERKAAMKPRKQKTTRNVEASSPPAADLFAAFGVPISQPSSAGATDARASNQGLTEAIERAEREWIDTRIKAEIANRKD